jgi:uncharacterized protein (TIGR00369 family)
MIKQQMTSTVPFAAHNGVNIVEISDGEAIAKISQTPNSINHIGSQHAGALFTLGETASGCAMAGTFAEHILSIRPLAVDARIKYTKIAKGSIKARATVGADTNALRATLLAEGKISFNIDVAMTDEANRIVSEMTVNWHIRKS